MRRMAEEAQTRPCRSRRVLPCVAKIGARWMPIALLGAFWPQHTSDMAVLDGDRVDTALPSATIDE